MPGCPSRLRPYLKGEGITKKSNPWKTTSLDRSIMGNQLYNGWCSHLGWAASFIKRAKLNYIFRLLHSKSMPGCPSRLRPYLEGEGITKKSNPWKTTSLDRSIMGNQHYNGWCSHLGWAASFIKRAKLNYIFR